VGGVSDEDVVIKDVLSDRISNAGIVQHLSSQ
jgi:hypothetical protein